MVHASMHWRTTAAHWVRGRDTGMGYGGPGGGQLRCAPPFVGISTPADAWKCLRSSVAVHWVHQSMPATPAAPAVHLAWLAWQQLGRPLCGSYKSLSELQGPHYVCVVVPATGLCVVPRKAAGAHVSLTAPS
jgi:hypothetical protein